jgi:hypothetical protein
LDPSERLKHDPITGQRCTIRYRVLTHEEWALTHPGACRFMEHVERGGGQRLQREKRA